MIKRSFHYAFYEQSYKNEKLHTTHKSGKKIYKNDLVLWGVMPNHYSYVNCQNTSVYTIKQSLVQ